MPNLGGHAKISPGPEAVRKLRKLFPETECLHECIEKACIHVTAMRRIAVDSYLQTAIRCRIQQLTMSEQKEIEYYKEIMQCLTGMIDS